MARTPGQPIGERVAVVENKLDQLHERLADHEKHVNSKLDLILEGQRVGQEDRRDMRAQMSAMSTEVKAMKPHVQTVAEWKTIWKALGLISAAAAGIGSAVAIGWSHIKPFILFQMGK